MPASETPSDDHRQHEITQLLKQAGAGDASAMEDIFQLSYAELKELARSRRRHWVGDNTLNTTALVHEAYLKLVRQDEHTWNDRLHFFRVASRAMRQVLLNYAERRQALKRGGAGHDVTLDEINPVSEEAAEEVIAVNGALERLANIDPRPVAVVECRFFAGLTIPETAAALGVSASTVERDWKVASAWLKRELGGVAGGLGMG